MARKNYKIVIRHQGNGSKEAFTYKYRGTTISLKTRTNEIVVEFSKNVKGINILDDPYFYDLLRRAHLVYALNCGKKLEIKDIKIDDNTVYNKKNNDVFPFVFAMMGSNIRLTDAWKEKKFVEKMLSYTQTSASEDLRIPAVYSFLASSSSDYEAQKFSSLWTAMNAYYQNIIFNGKRRSETEDDKTILGKIRQNERNALTDFMRIEFNCEKEFPCKKSQDTKDRIDMHRKLIKLLAALSQDETERLYRSSYDKMLGKEIEPNDAIAKIESFSVTQLPVFCLLLIEFPYYLRCNYFHGNRAPLLFSTASSIELRALKAVNHFLTKYLSENIPKMFADGFIIPKMDS